MEGAAKFPAMNLKETGACVILVAVGTADIKPDGPGVRVAALVHDAIDVGAAFGGAGDESGPQAVPGEVLYCEACRGGLSLHDQRHALRGNI